MEKENSRSMIDSQTKEVVLKIILVITCYLILGVCDRLWLFGSRPIIWIIRITISIALSNILLFWISKFIIKLPAELSIQIYEVSQKEKVYLFLMILDYIVMILAYNTCLTSIIPYGYTWLNNILFLSAAIFILLFSDDYKRIENRFTANFLLLIMASSIMYYLKDGDLFIYMMYVFIFASYGISEKRAMRSVLEFSIAVMVLVYSLSLIGVLPYDVNNYGFVIKRNIGFNDPNGASMHVMFIILLLLYINAVKSKVSFMIDFIAIFAAFVLIKYYIGARTSLIGIYYLLFITLVYAIYRLFFSNHTSQHWMKKNFAFIYFCIMMAISVFVSFGMAWIYEPGKSYWILDLLGRFFDVSNLESRFMEGGIALREFRPHLFGQVIVESNVPETYFWIDNFYIRALLKYGILLFICNIVSFIILAIRLRKKERNFELLILAIIPIIGISEALIGDPMYNLFPILAFSNLDLKNK